MLVLSRKRGGELVVTVNGVRVVLTVVDIDRGKVRLGVTAPPEVKVLRAELEGDGRQGAD